MGLGIEALRSGLRPRDSASVRAVTGHKRPCSPGLDPASPVGPARAHDATISPEAGAPGRSRARRGARPQRLAQKIATSGHPGRGQRPGRRLRVLGSGGGAEAGSSAEAWALSPVCRTVAKPPRGFAEAVPDRPILIELLREPYRIVRIAGRTDIQTGLQPRPGLLLATST